MLGFTSVKVFYLSFIISVVVLSIADVFQYKFSFKKSDKKKKKYLPYKMWMLDFMTFQK